MEDGRPMAEVKQRLWWCLVPDALKGMLPVTIEYRTGESEKPTGNREFFGRNRNSELGKAKNQLEIVCSSEEIEIPNSEKWKTNWKSWILQRKSKFRTRESEKPIGSLKMPTGNHKFQAGWNLVLLLWAGCNQQQSIYSFIFTILFTLYNSSFFISKR